MQYIALHDQLNALVAHRKLQNLETTNILCFDTVHDDEKAPSMWDEKHVKIKIKNHKEDHVGFDHDFNGGKKKVVTTAFLRRCYSINFVIYVFSCYDCNLSSNKCKPLQTFFIFLCCKQQKSSWKYVGPFAIFSCAFDVIYCIASARKVLQVALEL